MPGWGIALLVVGIVLLLVIAVVGYVIGVYNGLVRLKNNAEEAYSTMDVYMKKRYDVNENMLSGTLKSLFAVTENYPQLQANENFLSLQENLRNLEDEIANSRKYYNGCVKLLNNKIEVFPSNLVAKRFHYEKKVLFEVSNQEERVAPKVQF